MISSGRAASLVVTSYGALAAKDFMNLPTDKRNLGSYDLFQLLKYGDIIPVTGREELENGQAAANDFQNWMETESEKQLTENE